MELSHGKDAEQELKPVASSAAAAQHFITTVCVENRMAALNYPSLAVRVRNERVADHLGSIG
jgi:hypothetical protein